MTPWTVVRRGTRLVGRFIKMHPAAFTLAVLGSAVFAGAIIASSWAIGWISHEVIIPVLGQGEDPDLLGLAAGLLLGLALVKAVGIVVRRSSAAYLSSAVRRDVRNELVEHQLSLKMSWFDRQAIGDLLAVADSDVQRGTDVLGPLPFATGVSLLLFGAMAMIAAIDPWLALGAGVGLGAVIVIDVKGSWITYRMWEQVQQQRGVVSSIAHEAFDGALTVKSLGREDTVGSDFREQSDVLRDRLIDVNTAWTNYQVIVRSLPQVLIVLLLVVGAVRIGAGAINAGQMVTVAYLLSLLVFPIQLIGFVLWDGAGSLAGWKRVQEVFDADEFVNYGSMSADPVRKAAHLTGRTIDFSYSSEEPVFSGLELELQAGKTLAVVGPTGSGKTTLGLLLARLWDPDAGSVQIEGRDLRDFALSELPKEVSYVSQTAFLFDATVESNITLDEPFARDQVETALRMAGAFDLVSTLPHGLDTEIGERGATLSGGQRQRLALARALVRKPRLMILDDATSAVDPSVEAEILRALKSAELPSTIVMVAYRPSSIKLADEVVFVDDKRIVAHGAHAELLENVPGYARLVKAYEEEAERMKRESAS